MPYGGPPDAVARTERWVDVPVRFLVGLMRDQVVPRLALARAGRRSAAFTRGSGVRVPCRLATDSRLDLLDARSSGTLRVEPGAASVRFTGRRAGREVGVPAGGRVVVVTAAEPDRFAERVRRTVTRYESVPGRPVWIETTAHDAPLVQRALTGRAGVTPAG
ncbi:hypothetical protein [Kitasatospora sp. NBC_01539]|uniref:hypothetical protein n=1 Tax=Kitasatospora sp. NBC_01539 TaxID=2903577 RepID=UPI0038601FBC